MANPYADMAKVNVCPEVIGAFDNAASNSTNKDMIEEGSRAMHGSLRKSRTSHKMGADDVPKANLFDKLVSGAMPSCAPWLCWAVMICLVLLFMAAGAATVKMSTKEGWFVLSNSVTQSYFATQKLVGGSPSDISNGLWRDSSNSGRRLQQQQQQQQQQQNVRSKGFQQASLLFVAGKVKCPGTNCNLKADDLIHQQDAFQRVKAYENKIRNDPGFRRYCQLANASDPNNDDCSAARSVTTLKPRIVPTYGWAGFCNPTDNPSLRDLRLETQFLMPNFACNGNGTYLVQHGVPFLRSTLSFGAPLEPTRGDVNYDAETDKLKAMYATDFFELYSKTAKDLKKESGGRVEVLVSAAFTADKEVNALLMTDMTLAVLSFLFVFLYMWFNTSSFFIAIMGMLQVFFSLGPPLIIWRILDGANGLQSMQFLALFMILGIGADDVFVFNDTWNLNRKKFSNSEDRLSLFVVSFRQAASAMLATTATTALAFFLGVINPVPSIAAFCVFACLVVVFDFVWCITLTAASVAFNQRYIENTLCCCSGRVKPEGQCGQPGCCWGGVPLCFDKLHKREPGRSEESSIQWFFNGPLFRFMMAAKVPLLIFWLLLLIGAIVAVALGTKLASESPKGLPADHPIQRSQDIQSKYFTEAVPRQVLVVWGLADYPVTKWKSNTEAETIKFGDINSALSESGQEKILSLCQAPDTEANLRCLTQECMIKGKGRSCPTVTADNITRVQDLSCQTGRYCIMEQVKEFRLALNQSFPIPRDQFGPALRSQEWQRYMGRRMDKFRGAGETWYEDAYKTGTGIIFKESSDEPQFMYVTFNATFEGDFLPQDQSNRIYKQWNDFVKRYASGTTAVVIDLMFCFKVLQDSLVKEAIKSIILSLAVAFVTLCCVTWNWYIAVLGTINISAIVLYFMGTWPMIGWKLDIYNVIFLISAVGLSVDYTVHILHAYNESAEKTRGERTAEALSHMGITVFSGAITTLLAAIPLTGCSMVFFSRYGTFVFIIILVSIVTALFLLTPLLLVLGPNENFGDIACCYWLYAKMSGTPPGEDQVTRLGSKNRQPESPKIDITGKPQGHDQVTPFASNLARDEAGNI